MLWSETSSAAWHSKHSISFMNSDAPPYIQRESFKGMYFWISTASLFCFQQAICLDLEVVVLYFLGMSFVFLWASIFFSWMIELNTGSEEDDVYHVDLLGDPYFFKK
jgi:hypothetical protein